MAENTAIIAGRELSISTKHSVEICNFIRHKNVNVAKKLLEDVIKLKSAIPYRRFKREVPHRKGSMAGGRFPVKASKEILGLLKGVEANAQYKGLDINNLIIKKAMANRATTQFHYGRQRRIKMKRTHVDIIVEEKIQENKKGAVKNMKQKMQVSENKK